jgi:hypothetical protein
MKKITGIASVTAVTLALAFSTAADAGGRGGGTGIGVGIGVGTGGSASANNGDTYANGGMGAAACTGSVMTPLIGASWSIKKCVEWNMALQAHTAGVISDEQLQDVYVRLSGLWKR